MAHLEQRRFFEQVKTDHPQFFQGVDVLEVGSLDINGSLRDLFKDCNYLGVDVAAGRGVDLVAFGQNLDFPDRHFDVCLSAECFEHNPEWVATFTNMARMSSGLVLMSCATTGREEHGTSRCHPGSSPLTVRLWDYYRNLTEQDFTEQLDMDSMFGEWAFSTNEVSHDLYFIGLVK